MLVSVGPLQLSTPQPGLGFMTELPNRTLASFEASFVGVEFQ
jgi:hypothetical protein